MSKHPADGSEPEAHEDRSADDRDPLHGEGGGEGIELTAGEPSSFEPEEDPGAQGNTATD